MPKIFPVLTLNEPSLRERSVEVETQEITTPDFQKFLDDLLRTMISSDGVGIAAPQVGLNKRILITTIGSEPKVLINPTVTKASQATIETEEGCLSVPGVYGMVTRPKKVTVKAIDRHGRRIEIELKNFDATVVQHEIDHLDGILFIDKATKITRGKL